MGEIQKKQKRPGLFSFQAKTHGVFDMGVWCMEGSETKRVGQTQFKAKRTGPSASGLPWLTRAKISQKKSRSKTY